MGFDRLNPNGWIWLGDQPVASVSQARTRSGATLAVQTRVGYSDTRMGAAMRHAAHDLGAQKADKKLPELFMALTR
ncbi:MAG: hypothetical protein AB3X41_06515 [Leptothrix ochracea]|uniref:hypothetical protein n=1 Tax=Leptothrix ochracea TaxID=735331 RepID=UPI0034E2F751